MKSVTFPSAVYKRGDVWWFKFNWNGKAVRESTKQSNKRIAEQIEAARKTGLATGQVGIRDRAPVPTLKEFADNKFRPFIDARFTNKPNTLDYYRNGLRSLEAHAPLARCTLDTITADRISEFIAKLRLSGSVASINRQLEVLRRMLKLAIEWGSVEKALPKVEMLPGENHRERALTSDEEGHYFAAATAIGEGVAGAYLRALQGIRATMRGQKPIKPEDPLQLRDVTALLIDCGLRPDECFRLRWECVRDEALNVRFGKRDNARRTIPLRPRAVAFLEMRRPIATGEWVFPAPTKSGHIEKSSLKKQHAKTCKLPKIEPFVVYPLRHTCLTRWAEYMDPYTLAYLAGHSDFSTTKRYVHPQAHTVLEAMERAREGQARHKTGHSEQHEALNGSLVVAAKSLI